ncbi:hypothetical protein [Sutcliffiella sp. NC1]|uniref:hypothetical protein n=1 Tax=Sutcliffiella sp. NC1 TaxID=3004096 RepID=UPI0022DD164A|nr:hypothetical protein [Sutcliffiella sp. NC1]WBL16404.1 hypothetical protein O1A01_07160 [Sutcliffiella sp. NC1]
MAVYFITYDLNKTGQNYDDLYEKIKEFGDWYHFMKSCWFVSVNYETCESIREKLISVMDNNDYLFVDQVTSNRDGWLPQDVWDWLRQRL